MAGFISLRAPSGQAFEAFLAQPERPNGRGLVLLPEVYNVNRWIRSVALRHAAQGYTVLVPDLFWRQQPGGHYEYDQPEPARAQGAQVDVDAVVGDVGTAAGALRLRLGGQAPVAALGYCLGGRLALLAAAREVVDAAVSYYGVQLERHLDELALLRRPALLHFGDRDPWVPAEVLTQVRARLLGLNGIESHVFTGAGHGFDRDGQPTFDALASQRARELSRGWLQRHLQPSTQPGTAQPSRS